MTNTARCQDAFEHASVPYGDDGRLVRGIIARCGAPDCGVFIQLPVNNVQGHAKTDPNVEFQFIVRKLEAKGWRVGRSRGAHRCPKCFGAAKFSAIRKAKEAAAMADKLQVVDNPRVMTRDDRRIIFEKLNEVYVNDKVGYAAGWTDEKVSVDLGVPRGWVKLIRDENFGDEISNEGMREQIAEARALLAQVKAIEPHLAEAHRLVSIADKIEKHLADIARVLK